MKRLSMKKYLIVIAAAAMLAGCAKNETVTPGANAPAEITFTTAPLTKADAQTFAEANLFQTYAYYTATKFDYTASGETFIDWSEVSYGTDSNWRITGKHYFWPKDGGYLSFFSWSLNTSSLKYADGTADPTVTFDPTGGITLSNYVSGNDFMVADPATDQTGNVKTYSHTGVPTLFRHKASQINFKVKTDKAYTGRTFALKEIKFVNVATTGTYVQGSDPTNATASSETWTAGTADRTVAYYTDDTATQLPFDENATAVPANGAVISVNGSAIIVPQGFTDTQTDRILSVTYTITKNGSSKDKTATITMNRLLGGSATVDAGLEKGKRYTITLSISASSEILWNPEVTDWETMEKGVTVTVE